MPKPACCASVMLLSQHFDEISLGHNKQLVSYIVRIWKILAFQEYEAGMVDNTKHVLFLEGVAQESNDKLENLEVSPPRNKVGQRTQKQDGTQHDFFENLVVCALHEIDVRSLLKHRAR